MKKFIALSLLLLSNQNYSSNQDNPMTALTLSLLRSQKCSISDEAVIPLCIGTGVVLCNFLHSKLGRAVNPSMNRSKNNADVYVNGCAAFLSTFFTIEALGRSSIGQKKKQFLFLLQQCLFRH